MYYVRVHRVSQLDGDCVDRLKEQGQTLLTESA